MTKQPDLKVLGHGDNIPALLWQINVNCPLKDKTMRTSA